MKSILIHKQFFFSNEWHLSIWNSPCLLEFLDLIIIGFFAHAKSLLTLTRNTPFDTIHLSSRALLNSHWFCHYSEKHFFHTCLIIKYLIHSLWKAFQYMRLCISIYPRLIHNTLTSHFEYHILQQASFRYWSKFIIINTYLNLHDIQCLLSFSY